MVILSLSIIDLSEANKQIPICRIESNTPTDFHIKGLSGLSICLLQSKSMLYIEWAFDFSDKNITLSRACLYNGKLCVGRLLGGEIFFVPRDEGQVEDKLQHHDDAKQNEKVQKPMPLFGHFNADGGLEREKVVCAVFYTLQLLVVVDGVRANRIDINRRPAEKSNAREACEDMLFLEAHLATHGDIRADDDQKRVEQVILVCARVSECLRGINAVE